jgi:hypothetical protein
LKSSLKSEHKRDSLKIDFYVKNRGYKKIIPIKNGFAELVRITDNNIALYYTIYNKDAAISTKTSQLHPGGRLGINLTGKSMTIGEWDGAGIRTTHKEFGGRVTSGDNVLFYPNDVNDNNRHSTHVAGTLVAEGKSAQAKGMAPEANLIGHDWNNDEAEMANFASKGYLVSNHSYGLVGSMLPIWYFGYYDTKAETWDRLAYNAQHYLIVKAAGNDRGFNSNIGGYLNPTKNGYDLLTGAAVAKNILTVGAVHDINQVNSPADIKMSPFSSWGPTDDGRIKPDLVGNGVALTSSNSESNDSYLTISGTSMASPNVAGSLLLLQQYYQIKNGQFMRASTLKGLAIHSAQEAGTHNGPDYEFGWGLLNVEAAARIIENKNSSFIKELNLTNGSSYATTITSNGNEILEATICWTDVPYKPTGSAQTDNRTPNLVNDLDLRLTKDGVTYKPWILDPKTPNAPASKGDNIVDNVEKIQIKAPAGKYKLLVSHKGSISGSSQNFSLIVTGINNSNTPQLPPTTPTNIEVEETMSTSAKIKWESASENFNYKIRYKEFTSNSWKQTDIITTKNHTLTKLRPETGYEFQIKSISNQKESDFSDKKTFETTLCSTPTNLLDKSRNENSIELKWSALKDSKHYILEYKSIDEDSWTSKKTSGSSQVIGSLSSGTTYNFKLKSSCFDNYYSKYIMADYTTNCLPVSNLSISKITSNSVVLKWEKIRGISKYQIRYKKAKDNNWTSVSFDQNSGMLDNLKAGEKYEVQIKSICNNGAELNYSSSVNFSTYATSKGNNSSEDWIEKVEIGSINNRSGNNGGYQNFRHLSTKVSPGNTVDLTVQSGQKYNYPCYWKVWIDFNLDGDFNDDNEEVLKGISTSSEEAYKKSISIPSNAVNGNCMMRVSMRYNQYPAPNDTFKTGEVEDYSIIIGKEHSNQPLSGKELMSSIPSKSKLLVYPNPTRDFLNINLNNQLKEGGILYILNLLGQIIKEIPVDHRQRINVSHLPDGIYIIKYKTDDTTLSSKFIKL